MLPTIAHCNTFILYCKPLQFVFGFFHLEFGRDKKPWLNRFKPKPKKPKNLGFAFPATDCEHALDPLNPLQALSLRLLGYNSLQVMPGTAELRLKLNLAHSTAFCYPYGTGDMLSN